MDIKGLFRRTKAETASDSAAGPKPEEAEAPVAASDESDGQQTDQDADDATEGDAGDEQQTPAPADAPADGERRSPDAPEESDDAAAAHVEPAAGSQAMFAALTQKHGAAFADQAVKDGLTLAQAHERRGDELAAELAQVNARLKSHLQENGGMGDDSPASFAEGATDKERSQTVEEKRLAASVGPRLAKVAAAMEVSKRAPKSK